MSPPRRSPTRGEVWLAELSPVRAHAQGGTRPVVVVSHDILNHGPAEIAVVVPITTRDRGMTLRVAVEPTGGGLPKQSFAICEAVRSIPTERLVHRFGAINATTVASVEDRLRMLFTL